MADETAIRQRVKLWLRSEMALGVRAVAAPPVSEAPQAAAPVEGPRVAPAVAPARPPAPASPTLSVNAAPAGGLVPAVPDAGPFTAPVLSTVEKRQRLTALDNNEVRGCTRCRLHETRTHTVFGEGDADAQIFFIGEGPGENEDLQGRPFVGRAGQLLDKMIAGMGLKREQVFIANIVKCRPPGNRVPMPDEVGTCTPYLQRQLEIIRPKVIVTLGLPAAKYMLNNSTLTMGRIRGQWQSWRGIKLMPTFHPSYVLRVYTEQVRAQVWADLKEVMKELGMAIPARGKGQ